MSRQNNIINKPEPAPGTLGKLDLFGIGFGAVVGAGMVTLMGPAMAYTGYSVWLAMLLATVLALVMIFPYIILGGTLRVARWSVFCRDKPHQPFRGRSCDLFQPDFYRSVQYLCYGLWSLHEYGTADSFG